MAAETRDRPLALITGASGGIGEAFAHLLAAEAYALVLVARRNGELNRVAGVVTSRYDVPVTAIDADLSVADAPASLKEALDSRKLSPDVLINNAGWGLNLGVLDATVADQLNMIDLNVRALTELTLRFLPAIKERGRGGVLNIGSMAAFMPGPHMAVYHATKSYVVSFTEAVALQFRKFGNDLAEGGIAAGPDDEADLGGNMRQGGMGSVQERRGHRLSARCRCGGGVLLARAAAPDDFCRARILPHAGAALRLP